MHRRKCKGAYVAECHQSLKAAMQRTEELRQEGRPKEALSSAIKRSDNNPQDNRALYTKAIYLQFSGRLQEAETALRTVISRGLDLPDVRHALGVNLLAQGRYHEAWPLYAARAEMPHLRDGYPRQFPFPRWESESLEGKRIALFREQGFGDQIQFVRFVPHLCSIGASVTLLTPPPLVRLFATNFPNVEIVAASGSVEFEDPDYWLTLADLPGKLDIGFEDLGPDPYLSAPPGSSKPGSDLRVGFVGQGSPTHLHDRYRSLPTELVAKLERQLPGTIVPLTPEQSGAKDFADTAAIIAGLDVIVSVDTSAAHLAGAMGKPCMLLLSEFGTDWRWMRGRKTSPWYAAHRLYRNEIGGNWAKPLAQIAEDLSVMQAQKLHNIA